MKNQKGNAAVIVLLSILGILFALGFVAVGSYVSNANYANEAETQIKAVYRDNQNILGQYSLKVKEAAKVSDKYSEAITRFVTDSMTGRYGESGSKAQWQWIQENIPQFDATLFTKIQQIIEAGRNEYQVAQSRLLDICRVYETNRGYLWKGFWIRTAGYPKDAAKLEKMCTPITSEHAREAYETGIDKGVDF